MLKSLEINARGGILAPYTSFVVLQILTVAFLLIGTPAVAHLNFSSVTDTLSVLYLSIAYVRAVAGTGTLYAFVAAGGAVLWFTLGRFSDSMWISDRQKHDNKNKESKQRDD